MPTNHCMIIERSSIVRKVAARILANEGISVAEVNSFAEAIEKCSQTMPHTIIIDTGLPNGQSYELIRDIRAMEGGNSVVIIAMMIERDLATMTKAKRVGASDFMLKPFDRRQLLAAYFDAQRRSAVAA